MIRAIRVRGLGQLAGCLLGSLAVVVLMARTPMPFAHNSNNYAPIPSGPLLTAAPIIAIGWLWRDVTAPVSAVSIRSTTERWILWAAALIWTVVVTVCVTARTYPTITASTIAGIAGFFLGLLAITSSRYGALLGGTLTAATSLLGFLLAPLGTAGQWPYQSPNHITVLAIGLLILSAGTTIGLTKGFDGRRHQSGRLIGVNDT